MYFFEKLQYVDSCIALFLNIYRQFLMFGEIYHIHFILAEKISLNFITFIVFCLSTMILRTSLPSSDQTDSPKNHFWAQRSRRGMAKSIAMVFVYDLLIQVLQYVFVYLVRVLYYICGKSKFQQHVLY